MLKPKMETRNVTLTLKKAREFYNSGNDALKEIALQAFTKEELTTPEYTNIETFEDACKALGLNMDFVNFALCNMKNIEGGLGKHLTAIYKLDIIRKALNGTGWKPKMVEDNIYYSWVKFYLPNKKPSDRKTIATFKADGQKYLLVSDFGAYGCCGGLGDFDSEFEYGGSSTNLGLLCCKSEEIAQYMSEQFGKIIFDACYAQHIGTYKWIDKV